MEELNRIINELKRILETHRHTGVDTLQIDPAANPPNLEGATGTLPIENGGTGEITATDALNALLPDQTGNAGRVLSTDGTSPEWSQVFPVGFTDQGNQSTSVTFNVASVNKHKVTLTGNVTLSVSNAATGMVILLKIIQDGTGSRTVTWFSGITWPGGITPTLTTTASKADIFGFLCTGTNTYDGFIIGQNL